MKELGGLLIFVFFVGAMSLCLTLMLDTLFGIENLVAFAAQMFLLIACAWILYMLGRKGE